MHWLIDGFYGTLTHEGHFMPKTLIWLYIKVQDLCYNHTVCFRIWIIIIVVLMHSENSIYEIFCINYQLNHDEFGSWLLIGCWLLRMKPHLSDTDESWLQEYHMITSDESWLQEYHMITSAMKKVELDYYHELLEELSYYS